MALPKSYLLDQKRSAGIGLSISQTTPLGLLVRMRIQVHLKMVVFGEGVVLRVQNFVREILAKVMAAQVAMSKVMRSRS